MTSNVLEFCRNMKIPVNKLSIRMEGTRSANPDRISEIRATMEISGEIPPERVETFKRVAKGCRIHNTLKRSPRIDVDLKVADE
jgi:uncharacterized OsmC-like protein